MALRLWPRKRDARPPLPPANLLDGMGPGDYWQVGEHTVELIDRLAELRASDAVLDVGCGLGRIAWPLSHRLGRSGRYVGLDAASAYVDWCNSNLRLGRRFSFVHADVRTSAYNVDGSIAPEDFAFPFAPASFDVIVATSIFTHLLPAAAANYLEQISQTLGRAGRLFASFFLLDDAGLAAARTGTTYPTFTYPIAEGLLHDPEVPEDGVAYDPGWLTTNLERCGLQAVSIHRGVWKGGGPYYQDIVVARKV